MSEEKIVQDVEPVVKKEVDPVTIVDISPDSGEKRLETELVFTIEWTNPETNKRLVGTFTAVRPTLDMVAQIAIITARLCGGERVAGDIAFVNEMRAYLQVVLSDAPKWWTPETFYDAYPLRKVWDHVRSWQDSFRKKRVG